VRVALVHDYLTQYGGAERVLEALHERYPGAPVFTSVTDLAALPASFSSWDIRNSPMQRLPEVKRFHRALLPLFPAAFRSFTPALRDHDVVIADSSAWAHGVVVRDDAVLICYCHSPARFLYGDQGYLGPAQLPALASQLTPPIFSWLRRNDRRSAARVDRYLANSTNVARRIWNVYGREATVVYPPVDVERYASCDPHVEPESWYLVISRLVPHKRVDLAIDACSRLGKRLKVLGDGRSLADLRRRAGPTIEFLGRVDDDIAADHLRRCRALILPAAEDFGMTAVEAQAAGRPVIAYGEGGALESIVAAETGLFFAHQTPDSLIAAIRTFEERSWDTTRVRANAMRFSKPRFLKEIEAQVEEAIEEKRNRLSSSGKFVHTPRNIEF
jgi:glycosyltransferase involved in cell wall biosynthesis